MSIPDHITQSLSDDLITIICHNDEHGRIVANTADPNLFEGDHRIIMERAIKFWRQYDEAPKMETADLVQDILQDKNVRRAEAMRRTLVNMAQRAESINVQYAIDRIHRHTRVQQMKGAILESAEKINSQQDMAIEEVEEIWNELLRSRQGGFEPGMGLGEVSAVLAYMDRRAVEFDLGVPLLTRHGIVPSRGTVLLFLGFAKSGKSWFCVHIGKHNMIKKKKVLHISLEMSEEQVIQRYYQSMFSVPKRYSEISLTQFTYDEKERVSGFKFEMIKPPFGLDSPVVRDELETRMLMFGARMENVLIKRFAPRSLTINGLIAYLDGLEINNGFEPDLMIIDSPYLMKQIDKDYRISLGRNLEHIRAIAVDRNMAIVATHQTGRTGEVAEDITQVQTADTVIDYVRTEAERKLGLARMKVLYAREEEDKIGMIITQNLSLGQFYLSGAELKQSYFDVLKKESKSEDLETEEDE